MSDNETMEPEDVGNHENFLVSMSKIGKSDGRFRLQHKNDETQVLSQPLAELMGQSVTVENLLSSVNDKTKGKKDGKESNNDQIRQEFKRSYDKSVGKHKDLRLAAPASTVEEAKMNRSATRKKFSEQMNKWDAAVHSRRAASSISYPLQKADMSLKTADDQSQNFKPKTPLEEEVHLLLYGKEGKASTSNASSTGLSLRETREKLNELAKVRAHVAYQQLKLKRQNKIKSRKYRRQLRKEKKKEMEQMAKSDKESKEDEELDRVTERATLKHSKSSKGLHFVAKHADKTVKNQLLGAKDKKRRELLQKGKANSEEDSSDDDKSDMEESDNEVPSSLTNNDPNNPWTNKEDQLLQLIKQNNEAKKKDEAEKNVDPNAFLQVKMKGQDFSASENIGDADSDADEEILAGARSKIYEAFAEDEDIMRDFKKEAREKQENRNKKNNKNVALPGWGSWAGTTTQGKMKAKNNRAKNRNRILEKKNGPKESNSKKNGKGYQVIINESSKGQTVRNHQPTSLPFPFTGVSDFEASIRTPVGDTFVPRTSFKKLVKPKVTVAKGAIVEPVDKTELVNRGIAFDEEGEDDYEANVV